MSEPSDSPELQQLLLIKRYETPPTGFVDDFMKSFSDRQRSELLRSSARSILWERVNTYFEAWFAPKWGVAGAAFASLLALSAAGYLLRPGHSLQPTQTASAEPSSQSETFVVHAATAAPPDDRILIARHYDSGFTEAGMPVSGPTFIRVGLVGDEARFSTH